MLNSIVSIKGKLEALIKRENHSSSFILSAPRGSGKSIFVSEILEKVLDSDDVRNSNLLWIKSEKEKILISQIREIYDFLSKTSYNKTPRIIVIDPADHMNIQASNALLKILEDCNSNTYFILITHNLNSLLRTIRSRCINFKLPINQNDTTSIEESENEFHQAILEVLDKFDKDAQILYKFLDKYFAKDMSEKQWSIFSTSMEHILSKMIKSGSISEERSNMLCSQIRELIYKSDACSLSRYNVALLVFLKIRGI